MRGRVKYPGCDRFKYIHGIIGGQLPYTHDYGLASPPDCYVHTRFRLSTVTNISEFSGTIWRNEQYDEKMALGTWDDWHNFSFTRDGREIVSNFYIIPAGSVSLFHELGCPDGTECDR